MSVPTINDAIESYRTRVKSVTGSYPEDLTVAEFAGVNPALLFVGLDLNPEEMSRVGHERSSKALETAQGGVHIVDWGAGVWIDGCIHGRLLGALIADADETAGTSVPDSPPDPAAPPAVNPAVALHPPALDKLRRAAVAAIETYIGRPPAHDARGNKLVRELSWLVTDALMEELVRQGRPS